MIVFLLMNFIVGLSSFFITYRIFNFSDFLDSLLSLFIIYFSQIVITELILGILGNLYLKNVLLLNIAILLIIWIITRNKESSFSLIGIKDTLTKVLNDKVTLLCTCVILGFGLVKVIINLINPPFGWDSLNYHFTFPVEWLKNGNLDIPITISDDPSPSYYPINGSLYFLWLTMPLKNVFMADLGQVPFFILAFLAIFNLARKLKLRKESSFYAASLFFIIPNFFKQLQIAYVDVMVAALFLVCINYLFLLNEKFSWQNALIYSMSLGLLLGTKTLALPYFILLFIPFIYLWFKNINKFYFLIFLILALIILGSFTYIRNFIDTGNPLYPLDFKLFAKTIFKGVMDNNIYRAHFKTEDYRISKLLFHEGLGLQTTIFILPAIFLALPATFLKNKKNLNFYLAYFLMLPFLIYFVYRYIIPLANTRYLYSLLGIGMIIGFYLFEILDIPKRLINILVFICTVVSMAELAKRQELIISIIFTISLLFSFKFFLKFIEWLIKKPLLMVFLFTFIIFALILLNKNYTLNEYSRYIKMTRYSGFWIEVTYAWKWLNDNTSGNNIAYVGRPVPFPLYGTNFKNNVYYVSVNETEPVKLHYFPDSRYQWGYDFLSLHKNLEENGNYRSQADYSVWLNNLKRCNIEYLFIYSLHQTKDIEFPLEDKWAKANPDRFTPSFNNQTIHIYKILK